jgi:3-methylfumaryl-CoA hydratase
MTALDVEHLRSWIGKQETLHDQVTRFPIAALSATLDRDDPPPQAGDALPPLWHWLYFLPTARQSILGPDGHPARGGFLPPVPLPRRMWAGGRFAFHQPLRVDQPITRVSTVSDVTIKQGRNGALCFVLVKHAVSGPDGLALEEEHDIVYRDNPQPGEAPVPGKPVRTDGVWAREIVPSDPMLFRYSALTFNSHRIHYDRRYVIEVEGYPGLIVHGPLIATLLLDLLRRNTDRPVKSFRFRAVSPLFDVAAFSVHGAPDGNTAALWARNPVGHLAMEGEAGF